VLVELPVLGGDEGVDDGLGHLLDRDDDAPLGGEAGDLVAVDVEHARDQVGR